jgi:hypothetical protein
MTDYNKFTGAVMTDDVRSAAQAFVDELISSTMLAIRQDPRAYGFVTLKEHDARVTELLEANNREVERRRAAEARYNMLERQIGAAVLQRPVTTPEPAVPIALDGLCSECHTVAACVVTCGRLDCPVMSARKAAA